VNGKITVSGRDSDLTGIYGGSETITISVTAEDGVTTATYTIACKLPPSNDATLSSLRVLDCTVNECIEHTITPAFEPLTTSYIVGLGHTGICFFSGAVIPTTNHANATITVNGRETASGTGANFNGLIGFTLTIVVTAEDKATTVTYTIGCFRNTLC